MTRLLGLALIFIPGIFSVKPIQAAELPIQIDTEENFTCALTDAGNVYCWGSLTSAPEKLRADALVLGAQRIQNVSKASLIALGSNQACALNPAGAVVCWRVRLGQDGRMGFTGARTRKGLGQVTALDLSGDAACAAARDGAVRCWRGGQKAKKEVSLAQVSKLALAETYRCALSKGQVYCWGDPGPELGGRAEGQDPLVQVEGLSTQPLSGVRELVVRDKASCALMAEGPPLCWGRHPEFPMRGRLARPLSHMPAGLDLALGAGHYCLVSPAGKVVCLGANEFGQLGNGLSVSKDVAARRRASRRSGFGSRSRAPDPKPKLQFVRGLADAVQVATGRSHSCALSSTGEVRCWGANDMGQLGDGRRADRTRPSLVQGLPGQAKTVAQRPFDKRPLVIEHKKASPPAWLNVYFSKAKARSPYRGYRSYRRSRWTTSSIWSGLEVEAAGVKGAVVSARGAHYAIHLELGVLGPLEMPGPPKWLGMDGQDAIYVALSDGTLMKADSVRAALSLGGFRRIGKFPKARARDVTAGLLAVASGELLHLSSDGGQSWSKVRVEEGLELEQVFTRHDGVLVVQGKIPAEGGLTLISTDGGKSFFPSDFEPESLSRRGPWIYSHRCPKAVLSLDPEKWSELDYWNEGPSLRGWSGPFAGSSVVNPISIGRAANQVQPAPPEAPKEGDEVTGVDGPCRGGAGGIGGRGRGGESAPGCGIYCLVGTDGGQRPGSRVRYSFLSDADCEAPKGVCRTGSAMRRRPHLAIVHKGLPKLVQPVCALPRRVYSSAGIGLVLCEGDQGTGLYAVDGQARWSREGQIEPRAEDLGAVLAAPDGTLLLQQKVLGKGEQAVCPKAFLRPPRTLGPERWSEVHAEGVLAYRALSGGRALLVTPGGKPESISLLVQGGDGPPEPLLEDVLLDGDAMDLVVDEKGRLRFSFWMTTRGKKEMLLTRSGHFVPVAEKEGP